MRRDEAIRLIREHRAEIDAFGVKSLALFGSVARDEAGPESDVDILVEFEEPPLTYRRYCDVRFLMEDFLGAKVDLVTVPGIRPEIAANVRRDLLSVA